MEGEGRVRFCESCQTHVHAVEQYSSDEWEQVEQEATGRVCILLCGETTATPRSRRVVLIGALLTAVAPLWAQTGRVRIRVTDATGAGVPRAEVSLLDADDKPTRTVGANEAGEVIWTDLPLGDAHFVVIVPGFNSLRLAVTIRNANEQTVEARLEVAFIGTCNGRAKRPAYPCTASANSGLPFCASPDLKARQAQVVADFSLIASQQRVRAHGGLP